MIYHSTPWRGLNVLLGAMQLIKSKDVELDVYSSTQIYGDQFKTANDNQYKDLYEQAKSLPNVNYIGYVNNDEIRKNYHNMMFIVFLVYGKRLHVYLR